MLDLHGATVAEAERLLRRTVQRAAARGRPTVRVVHGASTSSRLYRNRTIQHALYDLLDAGALRPEVVDALRLDGATLLSLGVGGRPDRRPLTLADVR